VASGRQLPICTSRQHASGVPGPVHCIAGTFILASGFTCCGFEIHSFRFSGVLSRIPAAIFARVATFIRLGPFMCSTDLSFCMVM